MSKTPNKQNIDKTKEMIDELFKTREWNKYVIYDGSGRTVFLINGFAVKKLLYKIDDDSSFCTWYDNVTKNDCLDDGKHIEGFVVEDSDSFMFKVKLPYYREWKFLRGITQRVSKYGVITNPGCLTTALENYFYGYLRELKKNNPKYLESASIIELRDSFYKISKKVGDQYE